MIKFVGWLFFMVPLTFAFGTVGLIFLNSSSESFKSFGASGVTLIVYGYLKPDKLKHEVEKAKSDILFLKVYHIIYLLIASCLIVNFLVTIITELHEKHKGRLNEDDIIQYLTRMRKRGRKKKPLTDGRKLYDNIHIKRTEKKYYERISH